MVLCLITLSSLLGCRARFIQWFIYCNLGKIPFLSFIPGSYDYDVKHESFTICLILNGILVRQWELVLGSTPSRWKARSNVWSTDLLIHVHPVSNPNNDNNTTFYIDVVKRFGIKPSRAKVKNISDCFNSITTAYFQCQCFDSSCRLTSVVEFDSIDTWWVNNTLKQEWQSSFQYIA